MVSSFSHTEARLEENQPGAVCVAVKFCAVIKQLDRGFTDRGGAREILWTQHVQARQVTMRAEMQNTTK